MTIDRKRTLIIYLIPLFILMIPAIAMQFSDEVTWNYLDFIIAAVLLYGTAFLATLILWKVKNRKTRIAILVGLLLLLLVLWAEMAVGIFGTPLAGS